MIRLVFLLKRAEGMSLEDFQRYWRDEHAPLVASHASRLDIQRYVQVHALGDDSHQAAHDARGGMEAPYDGVAELWWDSEEALAVAMATEEGQAAGAALLEDEAKFIDLPRSPLWINLELPQVNPPGDGPLATPASPLVKLYFPLRLRSDLGFDEGQRYWRTQHGPIIRRHARAMGIERYMQVHRIESEIEAQLRASRGTEVAPYDGHAEVWVDRGVARTSADAREGNLRAIEDETRFIDFARSTMWFGKEHVIVDRIGA